MTSGTHVRLPDFVVIGAMKSGTTSLFSALGKLPGVRLPATKEPHFFSHPDVWSRGIDWYASLFAGIPTALRTGESSTSYTSPLYSKEAAARIAQTLPRARLVCLLREPRARLRSHFVHEVRRTREVRSFRAALMDPDSIYVRQSEYARCLEPYFERFDRSRMLIITLEALTADDAHGWHELQAHLDLDPSQGPFEETQNIASRKSQFRRPTLWLHDHGLTKHGKSLPPPVRAAARRLFLHRSPTYLTKVADAWSFPLPDEIERRLLDDEERLAAHLKMQQPLWGPRQSGQPGGS